RRGLHTRRLDGDAALRVARRCSAGRFALPRALRADSRLGPRHRRPGSGESARGDPVGRDALPLPAGLPAGGPGRRSRGRWRACSRRATGPRISRRAAGSRWGRARWAASCASGWIGSVDLTVAVVGPTGLVGGEILELLTTRQFPAGTVRLLGSLKTAGAEVEQAGRGEKIELLGPGSFEGVDLAFFAAGPTVSGEHAEAAPGAGAT